MKVLLHSAQSTITLSDNTHNTHVTLGPWDIPTARDQNELTRLFAAPSAYSIVSYDDYYFALVTKSKKPILALSYEKI